MAFEKYNDSKFCDRIPCRSNKSAKLVKNNLELRRQFELKVDGLKLFGVIHEPIGNAGPYPFVLFFHGFGGNKSGRHRYLVDLSAKLAENGIASIRFDLRGAGDSEGLFEDQTVQTQLEDVRAVFDSLGNFDKTRFGLLGRSFGGFLATLFAAELVKKGTPPKSIAILVPFFGFSGKSSSSSELPYPLGWNPSRTQLTFHGMPISNQLVEDLKRYSLTDSLKQLSNIPLFHVHAGQDTVVGIQHKEAFKNERADAIAESLFIELKNSDHELSDYLERKDSLEQVVEWFKRTL